MEGDRDLDDAAVEVDGEGVIQIVLAVEDDLGGLSERSGGEQKARGDIDDLEIFAVEAEQEITRAVGDNGVLERNRRIGIVEDELRPGVGVRPVNHDLRVCPGELRGRHVVIELVVQGDRRQRRAVGLCKRRRAVVARTSRRGLTRQYGASGPRSSPFREIGSQGSGAAGGDDGGQLDAGRTLRCVEGLDQLDRHRYVAVHDSNRL